MLRSLAATYVDRIMMNFPAISYKQARYKTATFIDSSNICRTIPDNTDSRSKIKLGFDLEREYFAYQEHACKRPLFFPLPLAATSG